MEHRFAQHNIEAAEKIIAGIVKASNLDYKNEEQIRSAAMFCTQSLQKALGENVTYGDAKEIRFLINRRLTEMIEELEAELK